MLMTRYKANFYCTLCDVHKQKFFKVAEKQIIFREKQCRDVLTKNEAMIKFVNILFIEFADFML